jgi:hypothetical protein
MIFGVGTPTDHQSGADAEEEPVRSDLTAARRFIGFTVNLGTPMRVSTSPAAGLVGVHRLYHPATKDFVYVSYPAEIAAAVQMFGYQDQGTVLYAASEDLGCTVPLYRYRHDSVHRLALDHERATLEADEWVYEHIAFYVVPASAGPPPTPPPTTTRRPRHFPSRLRARAGRRCRSGSATSPSGW